MLNEHKILFNNIKDFRHKVLITEAVGDDAIIKAIDNHQYIYIYYEGDKTNQKGYRTIRPYVLGTSRAGNKVIRAWQERGKSESYSFGQRGAEHDYWTDDDNKIKPGWRMFRLDKIASVYPTGKKFNKSDGTVMIPPKYKEGSDADMTSIITYVSTKTEPEFVPRDVSTRPKEGRWKKFINANGENVKLTPEDVKNLYYNAKKIQKKAAGQFFVAVDDEDNIYLIDFRNKNIFPKNAIIGDLAKLYNDIVKTTPESNTDQFFRNTLEKSKRERKLNPGTTKQENPTIPYNRKPFFKT
jgi:hypothetical protein